MMTMTCWIMTTTVMTRMRIATTLRATAITMTTTARACPAPRCMLLQAKMQTPLAASMTGHAQTPMTQILMRRTVSAWQLAAAELPPTRQAPLAWRQHRKRDPCPPLTASQRSLEAPTGMPAPLTHQALRVEALDVL